MGTVFDGAPNTTRRRWAGQHAMRGRTPVPGERLYDTVRRSSL